MKNNLHNHDGELPDGVAEKSHDFSKSLLEIAKRGVEMAIEKDEQEAENWIENEFAARLGKARSSVKGGTKNLKSSDPKESLLRAGGSGGSRGIPPAL